MTTPDLTPSRLRALADEWRMLDLQAAMTEAEIARYEKLPLLMATALENVADWRAGLGEREMTNIQRFTVYRRDISQRTTHTDLQRNPDDAPQCQGVIWTDGTVTLRWMTACRSTSVWASIEDCLNIHGHPEYGTVIDWHDGPPPEAWLRQVATHRAALENDA